MSFTTQIHQMQHLGLKSIHLMLHYGFHIKLFQTQCMSMRRIRNTFFFSYFLQRREEILKCITYLAALLSSSSSASCSFFCTSPFLLLLILKLINVFSLKNFLTNFRNFQVSDIDVLWCLFQIPETKLLWVWLLGKLELKHDFDI